MSTATTPKTWADENIDTGGRTTGHIKTHCPKCRHLRSNKHDKSLYVAVELGVWRCYYPPCGWTGTLGWDDEWKRSLDRPSYVKPTVPEERALSPQGREWLHGRGLDDLIAEEYGLYTNHIYTDEETGEIKSYGPNVITIPYVNANNEVVHLKHRAIGERKALWSSKNTELVFWGLDKLPKDIDTLYITEGEWDMLALAQCGFDCAVSVPNGASTSSNARLAYLEAAEDLITGIRKVIVCTDTDDAGNILADELIRRIGPEKCFRVYWPDGSKDANDVLVKHGAKALSSVLNSAVPVPVEGLYTGYDLEPKLIQLYRNGFDRGVDFGYPLLDKHYTIKTGYMTIVTGIPGHGKSTVLDQLLVRLASKHGWTFGIFSPEQQPLEWHQTQLIEQLVGEPFWDGPRQRMTIDTMLDANRWISDHFAFILPEASTIDSILAAAKIQIFRSGCKGIVIDPWNEIDHARPGGMTETEYISYILSRLRKFARDHDIHLWIVAHPTKMQLNKDTGEYPVPDLYDISGAAHWKNKADFGLVIHRPQVQDLNSAVDIHIRKSRRREIATAGAIIRMQYDSVTKRLVELPEDLQPEWQT